MARADQTDIPSGSIEFEGASILVVKTEFGGVELPEPLREAPAIDEEYWYTNITESDGVYTDTWDGLSYELLMLKRGGIFRTKEDALAWFDFEVKLRGGVF